MPIYRGTTPLKAYKGDMQPVNVYRGSTKVAGWHASSTSGQSPLVVDCDYNVPPDALTIDGKCSQVQSCWGTNLVTNGDFSNGTTGWTGGSSSLSVISGVANFLSAGKYGNAKATVSTIASHKYYICAHLKSTSSNVRIALLDTAERLDYRYSSGSNTFELISAVALCGSTTSSAIIKIQDMRSSDWDTVYFDNVSCIDLTAAFGAGKEPTAAQMDAIMAQFPNSWFDGTTQLSTDTTTYTPNSPSPSYPAPISTITGNATITGADGAASDTATVAFGSAVCASLPDGTHDSYDAVTGVLTKRVGKFIGSLGTSWTLSDAATNGSFMCDNLPAGNLSGQTLSAPSACAPTVYYALATPTTVQLTPHLPVVRTGVKTLSIEADVVPTLSATVRSMD